jgi:osmotically-inducible protein OsmY
MRWRRLLQASGWTIMAVLLVVGCASTPTTRSPGEVIDDAAITTKVKAGLIAEPAVKAFAINVDTSKGVVTLTGIVDSERQRQIAIQVAEGVSGVKQVEARNLFIRR